MNILVSGGAGYIGSHTCIELVKAGHNVVVVDNLYNSSKEAIRRVEEITGTKIKFYEVDLRDYELSKKIFEENKIEGIIHFAGLKAVGESVYKPLEYYQNNLDTTFVLLRLMKEFNVKNLVFSSSATVYGTPERLPLDEDCKTGGTTNPYGTTKVFIEQILRDVYNADKSLNIALLRYFNPIGAHPSGLIGEDPKGIPNNLCPYVTQVAIGKREVVHVFGDDYPTADGTGIRDYIHVCDLAYGHVLALKKLATNCGLVTYNLGTGKGYSVLDVIHAFEKACGHKIPYVIEPRRPGDLPSVYCNPEKAYNELGFKAQFGIEDMARDSWNWQQKNPEGYNTK